MSLFSSSLPQLSIWTLIDLSSEEGEGLPSACFHPNFILEITHRGVVSFCALVLNSSHMALLKRCCSCQLFSATWKD